MQQRLLQRGIRQPCFSRQSTQARQEQDSHIDRIRPYLLRKIHIFRYGMLQRTFTRDRCGVQHPFRGGHGLLQKPGVFGLAVQLRKERKGGQGIDDFYPIGLALIAVHPTQQIIQNLHLPAGSGVLHQRNHADPRHPIPVIDVHSPVSPVLLQGHVLKQ
ncbi:hypothetical protein D3C75_919530 [compost metagenome]